MRPAVVSALKFGAVDPKRSLDVAKQRQSVVLVLAREGKEVRSLEPTEVLEARHPLRQRVGGLYLDLT